VTYKLHHKRGSSCTLLTIKQGKAVPLQAWTVPGGSRKLRSPDFVTRAQDGGRLSALCTGRLYPRKYSWYSFMLEAESTPDATEPTKIKLNRVTLKDIIFEVLCRIDDIRSQVAKVI